MFLKNILHSGLLLHLGHGVRIHTTRLGILRLGGMNAQVTHGLVSTHMRGRKSALYHDAYA
jgi:hypothetical protein